jgi:RNA polymerase sigma-70 factor (ECF subfamily)
MSDTALIARVLDGDVEAFAGLVERYYTDCSRYARRMLGNRQDAEDTLQETFLRAYAALPRYRDRDQFRAWLFRILVNQCRTTAKLRARRVRRVMVDERQVDRAVVEAGEGNADLRDALQVSLDGLEPLLREAFLLKYGEGLEYAEMAALSGASVSALKMRVKRACDAMRPALEKMVRNE